MITEKLLIKSLKRLTVSLFLVFSVNSIYISSSLANEFEFSGKVGVEQRYFVDEGNDPEQVSHNQSSIVFEPELYWGWNNGSDSITFKPFLRLDSEDEERTHGDIRELSYIHAGDDWEVRTGIRKEFWGVTEFQHLVDVINQTDGVEDFDGEDKLGQLMVNLSVVNDWGIVDVFLLPGFRERQFNGSDGRLRLPILVDNDSISYQSSAKDQHLDLALRWSHSIGDFDIGSYWFHGTNRDPLLSLSVNDENVLFKQYYQQMDQLGFDVQATLGDFLWKFETIYRHTDIESYWATQAGFEYSYVGIFDSNIDLGLLMEHGWDSRGEGDGNSAGASVQNDLFIGARLAFNDMQSSEILMGMGSDLDHNGFSFLFEASRRLGESFKASLDVRLMQSNEPADLLYQIKNDDHLQLAIDWYF